MRTYDETEVRERLARELPSWTVEDGELVRTWETGDWRRTMLLANALAWVAESGFHHPDLHLSYPRLTARLTTHDAGGITDRDFETARRMEEAAGWRPGEGSALEGPPEPLAR